MPIHSARKSFARIMALAVAAAPLSAGPPARAEDGGASQHFPFALDGAYHEIETKYIFGFTDGADTGAEGETAIEFETNVALRRRNGTYAAAEQEIEFEAVPSQFFSFEWKSPRNRDGRQKRRRLRRSPSRGFQRFFDEFALRAHKPRTGRSYRPHRDGGAGMGARRRRQRPDRPQLRFDFQAYRRHGIDREPPLRRDQSDLSAASAASLGKRRLGALGDFRRDGGLRLARDPHRDDRRRASILSRARHARLWRLPGPCALCRAVAACAAHEENHALGSVFDAARRPRHGRRAAFGLSGFYPLSRALANSNTSFEPPVSSLRAPNGEIARGEQSSILR